MRHGSVGLLLPHTEAKVVDTATGEPLPRGADGEVWVRGPQLMRGYHDDPAATAATIDADGWLHTAISATSTRTATSSSSTASRS